MYTDYLLSDRNPGLFQLWYCKKLAKIYDQLITMHTVICVPINTYECTLQIHAYIQAYVHCVSENDVKSIIHLLVEDSTSPEDVQPNCLKIFGLFHIYFVILMCY